MISTGIELGVGFAIGVMLLIASVRWLRGPHPWIRRNGDYLWAFGVTGLMLAGTFIYATLHG